MVRTCDVVIVGARCAGATLATYLARTGVSVLLVDRSPLPSDLVLSTHTMHPSGMAVMDELGLGADVRAVSPEMRNIFFDWHGAQLDVALPPGHGEYCPRRARFDGLLQQAAQEAGAELRDRTAVTGLRREGGRVVGVELEDRAGVRTQVQAQLVVGADGRNSRVAQWVKAEEYLTYNAPRGMYWGYYAAPSDWGRSAAFPGGMYLHRSGTRILVAFHTDGDQLLIGVLPLKAELPAFRRDPCAALTAAAAEHPVFAAVVAAPPLEPVRGFVGDRYFFRRAVGQGWMLLGDAGHNKDFLSGDGMSEALIRARAASHSIVEALGSDERRAELAYQRFWRTRDVEALPIYYHARDLGAVDDTPVLNRAVFEYLKRDDSARAVFASMFSREIAPHAVVPAGRALCIALGAALRGEPRACVEFLRRGRTTQGILRELAARRQLLADLDEPEPPHRALQRTGLAVGLE